jgi:ribosomal protein S18 acetylase RimI-like enzyme
MLRPAGTADFAFIRALAGHPDNAPFLTDEDEAALAVYLTDPAARLLIWEDGAGKGYALFYGVGQPSGTVELRRLALEGTGRGRGAGFVRHLMDHAFTDLGAEKLWLDASGENARAAHLYAKLGFVPEGRQRAHWYRPALGRNVDVLMFGMLRDEWHRLP